MATSIAGAPQSDPLRIYLGPGFQIGDCATPIGDLPPGIDVLSRFAAADAEGPVVVEQHHKAGVSEGLGEPCDAVFLHAGVARAEDEMLPRPIWRRQRRRSVSWRFPARTLRSSLQMKLRISRQGPVGLICSKSEDLVLPRPFDRQIT